MCTCASQISMPFSPVQSAHTTRHRRSLQTRFPSTTKETHMPDRKTLRRAAKDKRQGKAATTQAGEFVREEIEHIREGKHGVRSTEQAIAIGLSKARRARVKLPPPKKGKASERTRKKRRTRLSQR